MDEMYEMIELTDAELDAVAAGQTTNNIGVQNNDFSVNFGVQVGVGQNNGNVDIF
jgi:hypothetical protein